MAKCYATWQQLSDPGYLGEGIANIGYQTTLQRMLENASVEIDHICRRHFDCWEGTYYFAGSGIWFLPDEDILSISELKLDTDGDGTYETTLSPSDYIMYPLSGPQPYPKLYLRSSLTSGYGTFASGIPSGVKITGIFGYGDGLSATPYYDSGITITVADASSTSVTMSTPNVLQEGHTIRVGSEQMYVKSLLGTSATVDRAVNGTTGAAHSAVGAYIYKYPGPVTESTLILATGWWKQRESPATFMAGSDIMGTYTITKAIEQIVERKLDHLIKRKLL